jgi:hypothetical protein
MCVIYLLRGVDIKKLVPELLKTAGPIPKGDARDVFLTRYGDTVFLTRTDAAGT